MKIGYVTTKELEQYAQLKGVCLTEPAVDLLRDAREYVESFPFAGLPTSKRQTLAWPRKDVWVHGKNLCSGTVPAEVKAAQIRCAIELCREAPNYSAVDALLDHLTPARAIVPAADSDPDNGPAETE